jgi:hypothetical protein
VPKFGLELHPEKTRLIEFGRYAAERRANVALARIRAGGVGQTGIPTATGGLLIRHAR